MDKELDNDTHLNLRLYCDIKYTGSHETIVPKCERFRCSVNFQRSVQRTSVKMIREIEERDFQSIAEMYNHFILNDTCTFEVKLIHLANKAALKFQNLLFDREINKNLHDCLFR